MNMNKRNLIVEVFTDYGYIDMDNTLEDPEDPNFVKKLKYVAYFDTGLISPRYDPVYRIKGPKSAVFTVVDEYWFDGDGSVDTIIELEGYWKSL